MMVMMLSMIMMMMVMVMMMLSMMVMISSGLTHPYEAEDSFPLGRLQKVASLQSDHYFSLFWGGKCSQFFSVPFCRLVALNAPITSSSPLQCTVKIVSGVDESGFEGQFKNSQILSCIRLSSFLSSILYQVEDLTS